MRSVVKTVFDIKTFTSALRLKRTVGRRTAPDIISDENEYESIVFL